jgi:hypothetical protein
MPGRCSTRSEVRCLQEDSLPRAYTRGGSGLDKLYRRTDKCEQALEHLITATTMYREMDMRFWVEQAEARREPNSG